MPIRPPTVHTQEWCPPNGETTHYASPNYQRTQSSLCLSTLPMDTQFMVPTHSPMGTRLTMPNHPTNEHMTHSVHTFYQWTHNSWYLPTLPMDTPHYAYQGWLVKKICGNQVNSLFHIYCRNKYKHKIHRYTHYVDYQLLLVLVLYS